MAHFSTYERPYGDWAPASREAPGAGNQRYFITAWWAWVALVGVLITVFGREFLPAKFGYDAALIQEFLALPDLWNGWSFESYINTARVWSLVLQVLPEAIAIPAYYCLLFAVAIRLLGVYEVRSVRYHLIAGGWLMCSAIFLSVLSKEMIALPVALFFCLAGSRSTRLLAAILFLSYAAFFRQYWVICYLYFVFALIALRMHIANRSRLAVCIMLLAFVLPFATTNLMGYEPLTDARITANTDRVDNPDARSAFNNPLENTGIATDIANAVVAWTYMNIPVALLLDRVPHYVFFAAFQVCSLWFFVAGCASFLRDAKRIQRPDSIHLRCAAFVIAYSLTQALFEPDFGSFLRHEIVLMIPMLILVFYRAHASRSLSS